jgi:homoserine kinase
LECRYQPASEWQITVSGRDAQSIPTDGSNLIRQTIAQYTPARFQLHIHNEIPVGKGLGSSAAALTAALRIAKPEWQPRELLNECAKLEGHPDNAAASVLGGLVAAMMSPDGETTAVQIPLPRGLALAVIVPNYPLSTAKARAALPACYPLADVVFNLQRTAVLTAALATGDLESIGRALEDRLHHPYRAPLIAGLTEALAHQSPGLLGCVLSGAGPSVLVFYRQGHPQCCAEIAALFPGSEIIQACAPVN